MAVNVSNVDYVVTLATSAALTCPANSQITFLKVNLSNSDTVPRLLTVWRVGNGGAAGASNLMLPPTSMGAGTTTLPFSGQTLMGGQTLQVKCSASGKMVLNIGFAQTP